MTTQLALPLLSPAERAFRDFDAAHPEVWALFERFALEAVAAGRRRFGHWHIMSHIRWYTEVETQDPQGFKLNNRWAAHYARKFVERHPEHAGLFELRAMKGDR